MAEVLGIVASGIAVSQVAGTAGGAVLKLRRLWNEVRNVPENIADLMEQINCLDPAFWEAEQHFIQNQLPPQLWDNTAAVRSAEYCRKALQRLVVLTDDLSSQINSKRRIERGMARVKVLLKKDDLGRLEQRLENAVRMLQLAQQSYLTTLVKLQPDIIVSKVTSRLESAQLSRRVVVNPGEETKETEQRNRVSDSRSQNTEIMNIKNEGGRLPRRKVSASMFGLVTMDLTSEGFVADVRPPQWLTGALSAWLLDVAKSHSSWKIHLRSYSVRPHDSAVFRAIDFDNVDRLRAMFDSGEASPFDRNEVGSTILHYACGGVAVKTIKLLRDMCLDIDAPNESGFIATDWIHWSSRIDDPCPPGPEVQLECARLIPSGTFISRTLEECRSCCRCPTISDVRVFWQLRPIVCPAHGETPLKSRLRQAEILACDCVSPSLEVFQHILSPDLSTDFDTVCRYYDDNPQLIHVLALAIANLADVLESENWTKLARAIIQKSDIHSLSFHYTPSHSKEFTNIDRQPLTPLLYMLFPQMDVKFASSHTWIQMRHSLLVSCRNWLSILKRAGINLVEYGLEEIRILHTCDSERRINSRRKVSGEPEIGPYKLMGFKIGPDVNDWDIFWSEPTDEFAGDFWNLIEDPMFRIPGAYVW